MTTDRPNYWESAAQDARVRRVSRMLPANDELITDDVAKQILGAARDYLEEFAITQQELAIALGVGATYISNLLGGKGYLPPQTRVDLLRKLNNWMEEDYRARLVKPPGDFVLLATSKVIKGAASDTKKLRTIGVVWGPAGIGKTLTAQYLVSDAELPGTMLVTVDYDCRTARGLLGKIYAASKLRRKLRKQPTLADVYERLRGSGRLLIVDQAHDLSNEAAFKLLMSLHDDCELPIMLLGTRDIHQYLSDDQDPQFGQLSSRIGVRCDLMAEVIFKTGRNGRRIQWVTLEQLRKMFDTHKLKLHPDVLQALCQIANFEVGHLRRVKWLVRCSVAIARAAGANVVTVAHLEEALRVVKGCKCKVTLPAADGALEATA